MGDQILRIGLAGDGPHARLGRKAKAGEILAQFHMFSTDEQLNETRKDKRGVLGAMSEARMGREMIIDLRGFHCEGTHKTVVL